MSGRVAVLGLGVMGSGMARSLLAANIPVTVYNRNPAKAESFAGVGARVATTPHQAAEGSSFVISMLTDDSAAREVWLGRDGAIHGASAGAIFIESSTVSVEWIRELGGAAGSAGFELLDAPVTGSRAQAEAGVLRYLVGGAEATLERARPLLEVLGSEIIHVGPAGSGAMMKLVNNFLVGVQAASLAEAMAFILKSGLEPAKAVEILVGGAPASPLVKMLSARMLARDYALNSPLHLTSKDLSYAAEEGLRHGIALTMADAARRVFEAAMAEGFGDEDMATVLEPMLAR